VSDVDDLVVERRMPVFTDRGSICAAYLRAHPEVLRADCWHCNDNSGVFAHIADLTKLIGQDGKECAIERDDERWSYHGLLIRVVRWKIKE
jgi:hypothetical protein